MNKNTLLIGIAGGTGSGKTTFAKSIVSSFKKADIVLIEQDSYYCDLSNLTLEERSHINFDHPNALDYNLMKNQLKDLIDGKTINMPVYDYINHTRTNQIKKIVKHPIIIIEGILALHDKELRNMMDIKIFIESSDDIRIIRRIKRDMEKRDRTLHSILKQYNNSVRPMHIEFVEATKQYADIIVPKGGKNKIAIDIIKTNIMALLLNLDQRNS